MVQRADRSAAACSSDDALLQGIVGGEREALGALYDRHARSMTEVGVRILGIRSEVEDVLHDVFLEVWRRAGDYDRRRGSVKSWLLVRMRSRSIDRARSPLMRRIDHDPVPMVEVHFEPRAESNRLHALLDRLPPPQRMVMELSYFRGLSLSEIASELAVPIGTVKSRLSTALAALRLGLGVVRTPE
jgi:RNA polymerase sigma-70 factor, ECF subfamily